MSEDYVIVKYDYLAQEEQELTIKKNERLKLLDDSKNWWKVVNDANNVGFVPSNYVRKESIVDKAKGTIKGLARGRNRSSDPEPEERPNGIERLAFSLNNNCALTPTSTNKISMMSTRTKAVVKFTYERRLDDELGLQKGEYVYVVEKSTDGWWKGEAPNGTTGWFPSNYVEEVEASSNGNQGSIENRNPSAAAPPPPPIQQSVAAPRASLEVVVALYSFDASSSEELSFKKGEHLEIVDHPAHDPDWWLAKNAYGTTGLVPRNYIEVVNDSKVPQQDFKPQFSGKGELPMEQEPWYFGRISRDRAEDLLQHGREGEFLVRDSESNPGDLSISMRGIERNKHFKVQNIGGQLKIGNRTFMNMSALINHYTTNPIFSSSTEKLRNLQSDSTSERAPQHPQTQSTNSVCAMTTTLQAVAVCDFFPQKADEIYVRRGEVVNVLEMGADDRYKVQTSLGITGWCSARVFNEQRIMDNFIAPRSFQTTSTGPSSRIPHNKMTTPTEAIAICSYIPRKIDEIYIKQGQVLNVLEVGVDGRIKVQSPLGSGYAWCPAWLLKKQSISGEIKSPMFESSSSWWSPQQSSPVVKAIAIASFSPQLPDEIFVEQGQVVIVLDCSEFSRWKIHTSHGVTGWCSSRVLNIHRTSEWNYLSSRDRLSVESGQRAVPSQSTPTRQIPPVPVMIQAIESYEAVEFNELSFKEGAKFDTIGGAEENDDFLYVRDVHGVKGFVPRRCFIELDSRKRQVSSPKHTSTKKFVVDIPHPSTRSPQKEATSISGPPPRLARTPLRLPAEWPPAKLTRSQNRNASSMPSALQGRTIERETFYYGNIPQHFTEALLERACRGTFLVRFELESGNLILSVSDSDEVHHFKVLEEGVQYRLGNVFFESVDKLIEHFKRFPIYGSKNNALVLGAPLEYRNLQSDSTSERGPQHPQTQSTNSVRTMTTTLQAVAVCDFFPQKADEIFVEEGQVVDVLEFGADCRWLIKERSTRVKEKSSPKFSSNGEECSSSKAPESPKSGQKAVPAEPVPVFIEAIDSYETSDREELSFEKGDKFEILVDEDGDEMYVEDAQGNTGFVPRRCFKWVKSRKRQVSFSEKISLMSFVSNSPFNANESGELTFKQGERFDLVREVCQDWLRVRNANGDIGLVPRQFLDVLENEVETESPARSPSTSPTPTAGPSPSPTQTSSRVPPRSPPEECTTTEFVSARSSFNATKKRELSVKIGERLQILHRHTDKRDFWRVQNSEGITGLVPRCHLDNVNAARKNFRLESYFFANLDQSRTDILLKRAPRGMFLVRSAIEPENLILSVRGLDKVHHFNVFGEGVRYRFGNEFFESVDQLIEHFKRFPIYGSKNNALVLGEPLE
ncbi:unnamed protein product [Caenorhabditis sp. 36 PRJEB53466]|nr:unnamed protein product [Caenorhabditis sp. 36 PRJEB53466]